MKLRFSESFAFDNQTKTAYYTYQDDKMKSYLVSLNRYSDESSNSSYNSDESSVSFTTDGVSDNFLNTILLETFENSTIFGSDFADDFVFLACFNRNVIISYNIKTRARREYSVPCPNDVCSDGEFIYVAGGTKILGMNIPSFGVIYKIHKRTGKMTTFLSGLTTLSGIRVKGDYLYVSRLYDFISISKATKQITVISDCKFLNIEYLSDNITVGPDGNITVSLYRKIDNDSVLKLRRVNSFFYMIGTIITQFVNLSRRSTFDLSNPEQLLEFSLQDEMDYIKYFIYNPNNGLLETRVIATPYMDDGHYTQMLDFDGNIIGVNFKTTHLLWIDRKSKIIFKHV